MNKGAYMSDLLLQRLSELEQRVGFLERAIAERDKDTSYDDSSDDSNSSRASSASSSAWTLIEAGHADLTELTAQIISLYFGKSIEGFANFIATSLRSADTHLLTSRRRRRRGNNNLLAVILVRPTPLGKRIVLELHASADVIPAVADKYIDLFSGETSTFAEVSAGALEDELLDAGMTNVTDTDIVSFVTHTPPARIFSYSRDPRRYSHPRHSGQPAPLGSYITLSGKRLSLFGRPSIPR